MNAAVRSPDLSQSEAASRLANINKVIVAIHGIGSQTRSSTIRSVVRQFGDQEQGVKLATMPLGFFHIGADGEAMISCLDNVPNGSRLARIGFVEVFWADIPRDVVDKQDTLEETKAWGRTIVSRAEATYIGGTERDQRLLAPEDFELAGGVIDEVVETVSVLEHICALGDKAGLFKFDLAQLLRDYVGDVQVVTEFAQFRKKIVFRFHRVMAHIAETLAKHKIDKPEIYIVAHSEGTVVSFLGLLEALAESTIPNPDPRPNEPSQVRTDWIHCVRGYMTLGSPIDKHLALWPKLWDHVRDKIGGSKLAQPIQWRNYYDFGDPVGFELDAARDFLRQAHCKAFEFEPPHDHGFSRYVLPGKAHNDYWQDKQLFGHFIDEVVDNPARRKLSPPGDKLAAKALGPAIPYLLTFLLHAAAVYCLYKGVADYFPDVRLSSISVDLLALSLFFTGVTIAARVPRLTKSTLSRLTVVLIAAALAASSVLFLNTVADFVGESLFNLRELGRPAMLVLGALIVMSGWVAPRKPRWGRRFLISLGGLLVLAIVAVGAYPLPEGQALWPAVLGALAFLYLWWLAILIFDLAFVWHRYIRHSAALEQLRDWESQCRRKHAPAPVGTQQLRSAS